MIEVTYVSGCEEPSGGVCDLISSYPKTKNLVVLLDEFSTFSKSIGSLYKSALILDDMHALVPDLSLYTISAALEVESVSSLVIFLVICFAKNLVTWPHT